MLITSKNILDTVCGKDESKRDKYKSIHDHMFKSFVKWTKEPTSLIYKLPKFGAFYFRKKETLHQLENLKAYSDVLSDIDYIQHRIKCYEFIMDEYVKFNEKKSKIKK